MALNMEWTVEMAHYVADSDFDEMVKNYDYWRRNGSDHIDALVKAVDSYVTGLEDWDYYNMGENQLRQIQEELNRVLAANEEEEEEEDCDPRCIPTIMELNP